MYRVLYRSMLERSPDYITDAPTNKNDFPAGHFYYVLFKAPELSLLAAPGVID